MEDQVKRKKPRKKRKMGCLGWFFAILLILLIGIGAYVAKVYMDLSKTSEVIYKPVETQQVRVEKVTVQSKKPISILLMGVDTGDLGRTEVGRADALMLMVLNPNSKTATLVSIPRDTRTEIVGYGTTDKINHAYAFGGVSMEVNTVQKYLNVPIDYYVEVNMAGLQQVVGAVGPFQVTPNATFTLNGSSFTEGVPVTLDQNNVLNFTRERYVDSDFGRQERQRMVIMGIAKKIASLDTITNYGPILETLGTNMQTNLTFADMQGLFLDYRDAVSNMEQIQMTGQGTMLDGVYYNIPDETQLKTVSEKLRQQLEL